MSPNLEAENSENGDRQIVSTQEPLSPTLQAAASESHPCPSLFPPHIARTIKWNIAGILSMAAGISSHDPNFADSARPPSYLRSPNPEESAPAPTVIRLSLNVDNPEYDLSMPTFQAQPDTNHELLQKPSTLADMSDAEFEILSATWEVSLQELLATFQPVESTDVATFTQQLKGIAAILAVSNDRIENDFITAKYFPDIHKKINEYLKAKGLYLFNSYEEVDANKAGAVLKLAKIVDTKYLEVRTSSDTKTFPVFDLDVPKLKYPQGAIVNGQASCPWREIIMVPSPIREKAEANGGPEKYENYYNDVLVHEGEHMVQCDSFPNGTVDPNTPLNVTFEIPFGDSYVPISGNLTPSAFREMAAYGLQYANSNAGNFMDLLLANIPATESSLSLYQSIMPYVVLANAPETDLSRSVMDEFRATGKVNPADAYSLLNGDRTNIGFNELHSIGSDLYRIGTAMLAATEDLHQPSHPTN